MLSQAQAGIPAKAQPCWTVLGSRGTAGAAAAAGAIGAFGAAIDPAGRSVASIETSPSSAMFFLNALMPLAKSPISVLTLPPPNNTRMIASTDQPMPDAQTAHM